MDVLVQQVRDLEIEPRPRLLEGTGLREFCRVVARMAGLQAAFAGKQEE
jgi:hypothetical protein